MRYSVRELTEGGWVIVEVIDECVVIWELGDWKLRHNTISGEILEAYCKGVKI